MAPHGNPTAIFGPFQKILQIVFLDGQYYSQDFFINFEFVVVFSTISLDCFPSMSFILGARCDIPAIFSVFSAGNQWQPVATAGNRLATRKKLFYFYESLDNIGLLISTFYVDNISGIQISEGIRIAKINF